MSAPAEKGFLRQLAARLGNPLRWSVADKSLLAAAFALPLIVTSYGLNLFIRANPKIAPYYDFPFLNFYLHWHEGIIAGWLALAAAALIFRKKNPNSRFLVYAVSQYGCITNTAYMYFPGYFTSPYLIMVLGGAMLLLLFFQGRPAFLGILSTLTVYAGISIAEGLRWIPSSPLLRYPPYIDGQLSSWWITVTASLSFVMMLLIFGISAFSIEQWRDREEKLEELSQTDALTGLPNRRRFLDALAGEVARAARLDRPLALVLCDADHFKRVNDTHGHPTGDEVLREIANVLSASIREGIDTPARIGGEEFAVILSETDLEGAQKFAARVMSAIRALSFHRNGTRFGVTLSLGVAAERGERVDSETLLEAADSLLYRAKRGGRDRVEAAAVTELSKGS
ncbi:MAG: GGDEF domain-containing protein [Bdellovibrionota bacterium]